MWVAITKNIYALNNVYINIHFKKSLSQLTGVYIFR